MDKGNWLLHKNVLLILVVSINVNGRNIQTFILEKFEEKKL